MTVSFKGKKASRREFLAGAAAAGAGTVAPSAAAAAGDPLITAKQIWAQATGDGDDLWITLTVEDPMFLREPASYTTRWIPAREGYKLAAYDCDAESSRAMVRFFPSKYK